MSRNYSLKIVSTLIATLIATPALGQDAPVGSPDQLPPTTPVIRNDAPVVPQTNVRVSDLKEPTRTETHLPVNAVYNISTLDQRLRQYIPNFNRPTVGILTGGQPMPQAWEHVANAGVKTVINLRPRGEIGIRDEAAEVRQAGMTYVEIPIHGPADLTHANADRLWEAMRASRGGVLVHCSSGNRAAALLSLAAHWEAGVSAPEALKFGKSAGLTDLEPTVQLLLDGKPLPAAAPATPTKAAAKR